MMLLERLLIVHMPQMTQSLLDTKTDPFVALPPGEIRPPCKLIDRTHHVTEKVTQVSRDLIKLLYIIVSVPFFLLRIQIQDKWWQAEVEVHKAARVGK